MTADPTTTGTTRHGPVHLVEVGGAGGIFQHAVSLGASLAAVGVPVTLHTADEPEIEEVEGVTVCRCVHWYEGKPGPARKALVMASWVLRTIPHLLRVARRGSLVHVHGMRGYWFTAAMLVPLSLRPAELAYTPHNTFARSGKASHDRLIRAMARRADVCFMFTDADIATLTSWGATPAKSELNIMVPDPDPERVAEYRRRYGEGPVGILAGQVRKDKRPGLFVEACSAAGVLPALVGSAVDAEDEVRDAAEACGVGLYREAGYLPIEDLVAATVAADVVVTPYAQASGSGALALARQFGVRSVAPNVGGLAEMASTRAEGDSAEALAAAIGDALAGPAPEPVDLVARARDDHLAGYRSTGWT